MSKSSPSLNPTPCVGCEGKLTPGSASQIVASGNHHIGKKVHALKPEAFVNGDGLFTTGVEMQAVEGLHPERLEFNVAHDKLSSLRSQKPPALKVTLPDGSLAQLLKQSITTPDFQVVTSAGDDTKAIETGLHYHGIISGTDSIVTLALYSDQVHGAIMSKDKGHYTLARVGATHALYPDGVLPPSIQKEGHDWCPTNHHPPGRPYTLAELKGPTDTTASSNNCVRFYYEADTDVFNSFGTVQATTTYIMNFFSQVTIMYSNEGIPVTISQIYVWNTASPYTGTDSGTLLGQFQSYRTSFNGDIGQLLGLRGGGGIAATIGGLCGPRSLSQCFCEIYTSYSNYPTYSWTVEVATHEGGHILGSHHTQWCGWVGGAIDGCWPPEGSCPQPGLPPFGTTMSYCHLTSVGISFPAGFGPQPGNAIRSYFAAATCLQACGGGGNPVITVNPTSFNFVGTQGGPNPATQTLSITNTGSGALNWTRVINNAPWLSTNPVSGTAPSTTTLSVNTAGLTAGSYSGSITLSATGAANVVVPVTLQVNASTPIIHVSPTSLTFNAQVGASNPPGQAVQVTNSGAGTLTWNLSASTSWLSANPTSGTAPSTMNVLVNIAGLAVGTYHGNVNFSGSGAANVTLPVTLNVTSPPGCQGTLFTGSFSGANDFKIIPYTAAAAGTHTVALVGPNGSDYDLQLYFFDPTLSVYVWNAVAKSQGPTAVENISYNGAAGSYFIFARSYSGSGTYTICYNHP